MDFLSTGQNLLYPSVSEGFGLMPLEANHTIMQGPNYSKNYSNLMISKGNSISNPSIGNRKPLSFQEPFLHPHITDKKGLFPLIISCLVSMGATYIKLFKNSQCL